MGHFRSTIIGNFVANLFESVGHSVTRINYLGDWGTQFGILKYSYDAKRMSTSDLSENAIQKLHELYVWGNKAAEQDPSIVEAAKQIFKQMEEGDEEQLKAWKFFRDLTVNELERIYNRLNIRFDAFHGESMYPRERCREVVQRMRDKGLLKEDESGRLLYKMKIHSSKDSPENCKSRDITIVKSDGCMLYLTRDIAAAIDRFEKGLDRALYVVDTSQKDHFEALKQILLDCGYTWASQLQHVMFGRLLGMSTRRGEAVFLDDVFNEAKMRMVTDQEQSKNTNFDNIETAHHAADIVGTSALVIADLKRKLRKNYTFLWNEALQSNGETGVRLQYLHCRLINLELNCGVSYNKEARLTSLVEPEAISVVRHIARFDEVLFQTHNTLESNILVRYLFDLSDVINLAYKKFPVKGSPESVAQDRLVLFRAARHALAAGLRILGIRPLNKM